MNESLIRRAIELAQCLRALGNNVLVNVYAAVPLPRHASFALTSGRSALDSDGAPSSNSKEVLQSTLTLVLRRRVLSYKVFLGMPNGDSCHGALIHNSLLDMPKTKMQVIHGIGAMAAVTVLGRTMVGKST